MHRISSLICLSALFAGSAFGQNFDPASIPSPLRKSGATGKLRNAHQSGKIRISSMESLVRISWAASGKENEDPDFTLVWDPQEGTLGSHKLATATQDIVARVYPTAACVVSKDLILVAGINRAGETVVESWPISWPSPMPQISVDPTTGVSSVAPVLVGRGSTSVILQTDVPGQSLIRSLCVLRKQGDVPQEYIMQFNDSGDIYRAALDGQGPITLVGSSSETSGQLGLMPSLIGQDQNYLIFRDRPSHGYCYVLGRSVFGHFPPSPSTSFLYYTILVDSNRDGSLDSKLELTTGRWKSLLWWDMTDDINWWLN